MGHVRLAGRISEEERFGTKMGRIDVPRRDKCPDCTGPDQAIGNMHLQCPTCKGSGLLDGFTTQYFSGGSIYRLTPCTEEVARAVAARSEPEPVYG
jgi:DnaJ-class molecular chaperone